MMVSILILVLLVIILVAAVQFKSKIFEPEDLGKLNASEKLYRSTPDVDQKETELLDVIDSHMVDVPDDKVNLLKDIVEEWADIQRKTHLDRRSWVRNPEKDFE